MKFILSDIFQNCSDWSKFKKAKKIFKNVFDGDNGKIEIELSEKEIIKFGLDKPKREARNEK